MWPSSDHDPTGTTHSIPKSEAGWHAGRETSQWLPHTSSAAAPPTLRVVDLECGVDGGLDVALVGRARGGHDELTPSAHGMTTRGGEWRQELVVMDGKSLQ